LYGSSAGIAGRLPRHRDAIHDIATVYPPTASIDIIPVVFSWYFPDISPDQEADYF
jgi:hypothetical protein